MGLTYAQKIVDQGWDIEQLVQVCKGQEKKVDHLLRSLHVTDNHRQQFLAFLATQKVVIASFLLFVYISTE